MALSDVVNEDVDDEEDDTDISDEGEEEAGGGGYGGGGASTGFGETGALPGFAKPPSKAVQDESDRLYFQSFGQGSFSPNQQGGLTFTPASSKTGEGGTSTSPASIDPATMLPKMMASPTGRQQIRNLRQLAAAAKALKNVPEQIKMRVLSHLLGVGYSDPQQAATQRALMGAAYRHQLAAPDVAARQQQAQQGLALRQQQLQSTEANRRELQGIRRGQLGIRRQTAQEARRTHLDRARASVDSRISNMTRALNSIPDQNSDVATELHKRLITLHKQAAQFDKLAGDTGDEGNGGGAESGETY